MNCFVAVNNESRQIKGGNELARRLAISSEHRWSTYCFSTMASFGDGIDREGLSHTNSPIGPLRAQFGRQTAESTRGVSPAAARQFHSGHKKDDTRISFGVSIAAKNRAMLAADSPKLTNHEPLKSSAKFSKREGIPPEQSQTSPDMLASPRAVVGLQHFDWARRRASVGDVTPVSEIVGGNNHKHHRLPPRRNTTISRFVTQFD